MNVSVVFSHNRDVFDCVLSVCIQYSSHMFQLMAAVKIYCFHLHVPSVSVIHFPIVSNHFDVKPNSVLSTACIFSHAVVMS